MGLVTPPCSKHACYRNHRIINLIIKFIKQSALVTETFRNSKLLELCHFEEYD